MWHCSHSTPISHTQTQRESISSKGQPVHHFIQQSASHKIYIYDFWTVKFHANKWKKWHFQIHINFHRTLNAQTTMKYGRRNHYSKFACNCQEITRFIFQFSFTFLSHINTYIYASMAHMPSIATVFDEATEASSHSVKRIRVEINTQTSATILYYLQAGSTSIFLASMDALQLVVYLLSGVDTIISRILHRKV